MRLPAQVVMVVVVFPADPQSQFRQGLGLKYCSAILMSLNVVHICMLAGYKTSLDDDH